jgi:hypothetical protein
VKKLKDDPGSHSCELGRKAPVPVRTPVRAPPLAEVRLLPRNIPWSSIGQPLFLMDRGGGQWAGQAFLCSGGRYWRPKCLKISSSEATWKNVFYNRKRGLSSQGHAQCHHCTLCRAPHQWLPWDRLEREAKPRLRQGALCSKSSEVRSRPGCCGFQDGDFRL